MTTTVASKFDFTIKTCVITGLIAPDIPLDLIFNGYEEFAEELPPFTFEEDPEVCDPITYSIVAETSERRRLSSFYEFDPVTRILTLSGEIPGNLISITYKAELIDTVG